MIPGIKCIIDKDYFKQGQAYQIRTNTGLVVNAVLYSIKENILDFITTAMGWPCYSTIRITADDIADGSVKIQLLIPEEEKMTKIYQKRKGTR